MPPFIDAWIRELNNTQLLTDTGGKLSGKHVLFEERMGGEKKWTIYISASSKKVIIPPSKRVADMYAMYKLTASLLKEGSSEYAVIFSLSTPGGVGSRYIRLIELPDEHVMPMVCHRLMTALRDS
jgi:hypothetical protein